MKRTSSPCNDGVSVLDRPDPRDYMALIEARDFLRVYLPKLTDKQRRAIMAWAGGSTCRQIAAAEGITEQSAAERVRGGLRRLRECGGRYDATGSVTRIKDV